MLQWTERYKEKSYILEVTEIEGMGDLLCGRAMWQCFAKYIVKIPLLVKISNKSNPKLVVSTTGGANPKKLR